MFSIITKNINLININIEPDITATDPYIRAPRALMSRSIERDIVNTFT